MLFKTETLAKPTSWSTFDVLSLVGTWHFFVTRKYITAVGQAARDVSLSIADPPIPHQLWLKTTDVSL
jgi:hypothetical protein